MRFYIVTIFPDQLDSFLSIGVIGQARETGAIRVDLLNLRDFTDDPHRTVDDRPYGGGPGMVMKVEPFVRAIEEIRSGFDGELRVILLSAQGRLFSQEDAIRYSKLDGLVLLSGRYEGVDERILSFIDEEVSILCGT
jgi:tRNA (guanine37-N1)-methyltransferase